MGASEGQLPVGATVGEYEITGLLGEGGMGIVYSGVHPVIGKEVAIKVLSPNLSHTKDIVARFVQEARAVNQIGHPNIIDIFAFGESPELGHYFVMPRLSGEDLHQRVERTGPMSLPEAIAVTEQICDALDAAHEKGIYHRDLKPDNVFLVPRRRGGDAVKVLDFGIAKLSEGGAMTVTQTGSPMGTPLFMSPEQWEAVAIDHRTDIYALGILFGYMITGRFAFESQSAVALMRMHCDQPPTLPSSYGAPANVDGPIAQALAKDAHHRFDSSGAFVTAIKAAASGPAPRPLAHVPVVPHGPAPSLSTGLPQRGRSFIPWALGAGLIAVGVVVTALVVGGSSGDSEDSERSAAAGATDAAVTALAPTTKAPAITADAAPTIVPKPDDLVVVTVKTRPRGVSVVAVDGSILGVTPATLSVPRSKEPLPVVLRLDRYEDKLVSLTRDKNRTQSFRLKKSRKPRGGGTKPTASKPPATTDKPEKRPPGTEGGSNEGKWGTTTNPFDK